MARPKPLPASLRDTVFTSEDAAVLGIHRRRMSAADIMSVSPGVYQSGALQAGEPEDDDPLRLAIRDAALLRKIGGVISHRTAARYHGIPLPRWMQGDDGLDVILPGRRHTTLRPGITAHRRPLSEAHVVTVRGVRMTTPERTWCELASLLRPGQEEHLVAAGDYLVTPPWTPLGRGEPVSTTAALRRTLIETGRFKGVRMARAALPLVRVGADSPPETYLRLALVDAGLPEPQLQVSADPTDRYAPSTDLGYGQWKIALQYDGEHHRTGEQQARDARRDAWFQSHGWQVIRVTSEDLHDDFRRVIALVKRRARSFATAA